MQARKALRALKGLVRLQALVRGQILRRQVITRANSLPLLSTANNQTHVNRRGVLIADESPKDSDDKGKFLRPKTIGGTEIKVSKKN